MSNNIFDRELAKGHVGINRVFLHENTAFITLTKTGPSWHFGWVWQVHKAVPVGTYSSGRPMMAVGPLVDTGVAPWRLLASWIAKGAVERHRLLDQL